MNVLFWSKSRPWRLAFAGQALCYCPCYPLHFMNSFICHIFSTVFESCFFALIISTSILPALSVTSWYVSPCYTPFLFFLPKPRLCLCINLLFLLSRIKKLRFFCISRCSTIQQDTRFWFSSPCLFINPGLRFPVVINF